MEIKNPDVYEKVCFVCGNLCLDGNNRDMISKTPIIPNLINFTLTTRDLTPSYCTELLFFLKNLMETRQPITHFNELCVFINYLLAFPKITNDFLHQIFNILTQTIITS